MTQKIPGGGSFLFGFALFSGLNWISYRANSIFAKCRNNSRIDYMPSSEILTSLSQNKFLMGHADIKKQRLIYIELDLKLIMSKFYYWVWSKDSIRK